MSFWDFLPNLTGLREDLPVRLAWSCLTGLVALLDMFGAFSAFVGPYRPSSGVRSLTAFLMYGASLSLQRARSLRPCRHWQCIGPHSTPCTNLPDVGFSTFQTRYPRLCSNQSTKCWVQSQAARTNAVECSLDSTQPMSINVWTYWFPRWAIKRENSAAVVLEVDSVVMSGLSSSLPCIRLALTRLSRLFQPTPPGTP